MMRVRGWVLESFDKDVSEKEIYDEECSIYDISPTTPIIINKTRMYFK
jgi:hypothetical protein